MFFKFKLIFKSFSSKEKKLFFVLTVVFVLASIARLTLAINENSVFVAVAGGAYKEGIVGQPIAINPLISQNQTDLDISALVYPRLSDLLTTYEKNKNDQLYSLKLKEGMKWSDGEPMISDDVVFTIKTIQDPDTKSPLSKNWQGVVAERVSEIQVQLNLPTANSFFGDIIKNLPVIPKHVFGNIPAANLTLSSYNLEPVAGGPYRFKSFLKRKDGFITDYILTVNDNFPGEKPFINEFDFKFFASNNDLFQALRLRQINGLGSLLPLPPEDFGGNVKTEKISMPRYYAVFMNQGVNPYLKNQNFRRALAEAIDQEKVNREVFGGAATLINDLSLQPLQNRDNASSSFSYDPDNAKKFISGVRKNSKDKIELTLIVPPVEFLKRTAEIIKEGWLAAGIDQVNVSFRDADDLTNNVIKARNYELLLFGNALENPLDLYPFWHSSGRFYPGLNLALYQNSKVDNLLEATRETDDAEKQKDYFQKAVDFISGDNPAIFLFSLPYFYVHTTNLNGFALENNKDFIAAPAERFKSVNQWSVSVVRILK